MKAPESNKPAQQGAPTPAKRPLWPKLLTAVVLLGVGAIAISLLPRGYSQDISLIGKGSNVVVLLQEPFTVDGQENMDAMNDLRAEYEGHVKFVVADKKLEQGQKFAELYGVNSTAFVLFAPNGEKLGVFYGEQSPDELRKKMNSAFHL